MAVEAGAIQRAIRGLTVGMVKAHDDAQVRQWTNAIDEYDQQFQLPVSGNASQRGTWATTQVTFDLTMLYVPDQHESPYPNPLFTYGFELLKGLPMLTAAVLSWTTDEQLGVTGAMVTVGAFSGTERPMPFSAIVHLNFEGYAAPYNDDPDEDEATDTSGAAEIDTGGVQVDTDIEPPEDPT